MTRRTTYLVSAMLITGMALAAAVAPTYGSTAAPLPAPHWLPQPWLSLALVALTAIAELVYVQIDHGGQSEDLGLFEAAVVVDVLLLPPMTATLVAILGIAVASAIRRWPLVKSVYNLGMYAASTAALVLIVSAFRGTAGGFSVRLVAVLLAGTVAFAAVNLCCLAIALATSSDGSARAVIGAEWRLSALMAFGTVAIGTTTVALALLAPALLIFTCLPAASLTYGYRARARQAAEAQRSGRLLILSEILAGRHDVDDLLSTFVTTACDAFDADDAVVVLRPEGAADPVTAVGLDCDGAPYDELREATPDQLRLLDLVGTGPAAQEHRTGLPGGWRRALTAPLVAGGRHLGVVALGWRSHTGGAGARDETLLTPVASALAFALRGAEALGSLVDETAKLKAVVDRSSDGILVVDGTGIIEVWSPALAALTGRAADEVLGQRLRSVISAVDVHGAEVNFATVGLRSLTPEKPRTTVEVGIVRPDGEQRWTRCSHAGVFADGRLLRDVVIVHDVTRQRQVDRLKADFIATVSHELRTPVTPIKGYAELLRSRGDRMTAEKRAECLDFIVERADHLARLVEDLLLASKISAGSDNPVHQVHMVPVDLVELTKLAVRDVADDGRIRLDLGDRPAPVRCDPLRGRQVIANLVTNALKYSPSDRPVQVAVELGDRTARIAVTDQGRGIPADQLDRVFDKFHRVEDPLRMTTSGTGLGLYIARQLAGAMGGDITVRSTLGVGSTFVFHLPLHRPAATPAHAPTPYDHPARQVGSCENLAATGGRGADQRVLEEATWPRRTTATA